MEKPKQPRIFNRHPDKKEKRPKAQSRETRQNFWRRAAGSGSATKQHTKVPFGKRKEQRRAKNKRARASRKANR